jgi:hypothetical protein
MIRVVVGASALVLAGCAAFFFYGPGFLCIDDGRPRSPADIVVALAGPAAEDGQRVITGVELVQDRLAGILVLPLRHRALEWSWFVKHYKINDPPGDDRVIVGRREGPGDLGHYEIGGTFTEAAKTVEIMRRHRYRSAVIVSSCYHLRRARLAFDRASNGDRNLNFHFYPVDDGMFEGPEAWWLKEGAALRVADEYLKLLGGYVFYR